mmetsp:Transcript_86151/g.252082  ORF Transcript_86151/g.252082 Transcript_86151/m.252082 type:complete len:238 (-) Transcript_86151:73-786(-)
MRLLPAALLASFSCSVPLAAALRTEGASGSGLVASRLSQKPVDCEQFPSVCHDGLFDCHLQRPGTVSQITAPTNGHANLNAMCKMKYLKGYAQCIQGDPLGAAETTYAVQAGHGNAVRKMDAQFCFSAGHCNNTAVTVNTTLEEMEGMCDQIYGHDVWTKVGFTIMFTAMTKTTAPGRFNPWSQMACAMGAWNCDIIYCREKICNDPMWRSQYGSLSWWPVTEHWRNIIPAKHHTNI